MKLNVKEIAVFGMLGSLMFASKVAMQALANIHLLGAFIVAFTVVYRKKALYPIYIYVFLEGLFYGFNTWWFPYLYIWTILWGITMLLPKNMSEKASVVVYTVVCSLHGLSFGILYAPAQALFFGLDFKATLAWIASGAPFDIAHCIGNFLSSLLIVPLIKALKIAERSTGRL